LAFDERDFSNRIVKAVDEGLTVLGQTAAQVIYHYLYTRFQIQPEDVPENLHLFHDALQAMLGEGSRVVEKMIAISLYRGLGLNLEEHPDWLLVDYVNQANKTIRNGKQ
jgi:hypothetical protein